MPLLDYRRLLLELLAKLLLIVGMHSEVHVHVGEGLVVLFNAINGAFYFLERAARYLEKFSNVVVGELSK